MRKHVLKQDFRRPTYGQGVATVVHVAEAACAVAGQYKAVTDRGYASTGNLP